MSAVVTGFLGANLAHNLGVRDLTVEFWRDIVVLDEKESVSAFDTLVGVVRVVSNVLEEAADFVGVRRAPDLLILGVLEEMKVF